MEIITILNQVAFENTYVLVNDQAALLIDPGSNDTKILKTLEAIQKPLVAILLTHTHYDHIMSLDVVRKTYPDVPVYVSEKEASWLFSPLDNLSGQIRHADLPDIITKPADHFFQYEKLYELSGFSFEVRKHLVIQLVASPLFSQKTNCLSQVMLSFTKGSEGMIYQQEIINNLLPQFKQNSLVYPTILPSIPDMVPKRPLVMKKISIPF